MQKIAPFACVSLAFSVLALASPASASLVSAKPVAAPAQQSHVLLARHGADDAPGHQRHGRGRDDAPGDDHGGRRA